MLCLMKLELMPCLMTALSCRSLCVVPHCVLGLLLVSFHRQVETIAVIHLVNRTPATPAERTT